MIRLANVSDMPYVVRLEKRCFVPGCRNTLTVFTEQLKESPHLFFVDDKLRGYVNGWMTNDVDDEPSKDGKFLYISGLAVFPECRGLGIGRALMEAILSAGNADTMLLVPHEWKEAIKLYEKMGFVDTDEYTNILAPFGRYKDGLLMMRSK